MSEDLFRDNDAHENKQPADVLCSRTQSIVTIDKRKGLL